MPCHAITPTSLQHSTFWCLFKETNLISTSTHLLQTKMGSFYVNYSVYLVVMIITLSLFSSSASSTARFILVDQSGNGDYRTVQEAIDIVPANNGQLVFILVKPGIYREKVVVPMDKPFITISGTHEMNTIITWGDGGGIFSSATFTVFASDFVGRYLTIQNTYGTGTKAVALRVAGDRAAFFNCRITSHQDTLLDQRGTHYYNYCYIEGDTDFIFGNSASLFEKCHIHSLAEEWGPITAQRRQSPEENTGFTFLDCKVTGVKKGTVFLGRPWGGYSRVIFALSYMSNAIIPQGWDDWGDQTKQRTVYYGEYKCYGVGANASERVKWSRSLTEQEAEPFITASITGDRSWIRAAIGRSKHTELTV